MTNGQGFREHRIGMTIADREFSLFWQRRGPVRDRQRWPLLPWALPLVAATGIAIAMPVPRMAAGPQITVPLDAPAAMVKAPARVVAFRADQPKFAMPRLRKSGGSDNNALPSAAVATDGVPSQRAAFAAALQSGEPTDWLDAKTGENGIVVPGIADAKGCREVVVMTRRGDGRNDNVPITHCG